MLLRFAAGAAAVVAADAAYLGMPGCVGVGGACMSEYLESKSTCARHSTSDLICLRACVRYCTYKAGGQ
jgi:hypothetical protein